MLHNLAWENEMKGGKREQVYKWARGKGWDCGLSGTVCKDSQVGFPVPLYFYDQSCPSMQSHSQLTSVVEVCVCIVGEVSEKVNFNTLTSRCSGSLWA